MTIPALTPAPASVPNKFGGDPAAFDAAFQGWLEWQQTRSLEDPAFLGWIETKATAVDLGAAAVVAQNPVTNAAAAASSATAAAISAGTATTSASAATASANLAAADVAAQLASVKTQTEAARDQALAGLGAVDNSQTLTLLVAGLQMAFDMSGQGITLGATAKATAAAAVVGVEAALAGNATDIAALNAGVAVVLGWLGTVAAQVNGGFVKVAAGSATEPALAPAADRNTGWFYPAEDVGALATGGLERLRVDANGRLGLGTTAPSGLLDVADNKLRVRTAQTPASTTAAGNAGEFCWDANYIYVATATNTWRRSALTAW